MPKLSSKRQITIPVDQCKTLGLAPGDDLESFVVNGQITLVKKRSRAAKGLLAYVKARNSLTDEGSRQSAIS